MVSCYDAEVSYNCQNNTFHARYEIDTCDFNKHWVFVNLLTMFLLAMPLERENIALMFYF